MNENKISFIYCLNDEELFEESVRYVSALHVPENMKVEIIPIRGASSMCEGYNKGMDRSDAKYKVYLHQDVFIVNKNFICNTLKVFKGNVNLGIMGVKGEKKFSNSNKSVEENKVGKVYENIDGKMGLKIFNKVESDHAIVYAVDGLLIATQYDIQWREDIFRSWNFYDFSHSREFYRAGFYAGVFFQENPWVVHDCKGKIIDNTFEINKEFFIKEYESYENSKKKNDSFNLNIKKDSDVKYDILLTNKESYNKVKDLFFSTQNNTFSKKIIVSKMVGSIGWLMHTGYYSDYHLENELLEMANQLTYKESDSSFTDAIIKESSQFKVLHVISTAYSTGGHTKLLDKWIKLRKEYNETHSIVFTDQRDNIIPDWLLKNFKDTNGWYYVMENDYNFERKCLKLRRLAEEWADLIVLHTHPNDPIPIVAFGNKNGLPPVILANHADHVFWLNGIVCDAVLDIRKAGQKITRERRAIQNSSILPIPLMSKEIKMSNNKLRENYGLSKDAIVFLTIASGYKFTPHKNLNFPKTLKNILTENPKLILIVIGPSPQEEIWKEAIENTQGRIIVLGTQPNIEEFYELADVYLESFPIGSLTAELDAMLYGIPVIKAPNPLDDILSIGDYDSIEESAVGFDEYRELIHKYSYDKEFRIEQGNKQRQEVLEKHSEQGWNKTFNIILKENVFKKNTSNININRVKKPLEFDAIWAEMQRNSGEINFLAYELSFYNQILKNL